jgi:hypothetical protein
METAIWPLRHIGRTRAGLVVVGNVLATVELVEVVVGSELELVVEQAVRPIAMRARNGTVNRFVMGRS